MQQKYLKFEYESSVQSSNRFEKINNAPSEHLTSDKQ
jgi:hypothetical protein